jgi:hypothetical protein
MANSSNGPDWASKDDTRKIVNYGEGILFHSVRA